VTMTSVTTIILIIIDFVRRHPEPRTFGVKDLATDVGDIDQSFVKSADRM